MKTECPYSQSSIKTDEILVSFFLFFFMVEKLPHVKFSVVFSLNYLLLLLIIIYFYLRSNINLRQNKNLEIILMNGEWKSFYIPVFIPKSPGANHCQIFTLPIIALTNNPKYIILQFWRLKSNMGRQSHIPSGGSRAEPFSWPSAALLEATHIPGLLALHPRPPLPSSHIFFDLLVLLF